MLYDHGRPCCAAVRDGSMAAGECWSGAYHVGLVKAGRCAKPRKEALHLLLCLHRHQRHEYGSSTRASNLLTHTSVDTIPNPADCLQINNFGHHTADSASCKSLLWASMVVPRPTQCASNHTDMCRGR